MSAFDKTSLKNAETDALVGTPVQAVVDLRLVPKGTKGIVIKVKKQKTGELSTQVEWRLPRNSSWIPITGRAQFVLPRDRVKMTFNESESASSVTIPTDGWDGMPTHGNRKYLHIAVGSATISAFGLLLAANETVIIGLAVTIIATIVLFYSISTYSNSKGFPNRCKEERGT